MVRWSAVGLLTVFFLFGNYNFYDVKQAIIFYGSKIFPSSEFIGQMIFMVLLIYLLFTNEINRLFKFTKKKVKFKKDFK